MSQLLVRDRQAIVSAFCGAFPDCSLWGGSGFDWMLVGTSGLPGPVPEDRFTRPLRDPGLRAALADAGVEIPEQLGALFIGDAGYLRQLVGVSPPLVDDFPRRIMAEATQEPSSVPRDFYRRGMDAGGARERFARSTFIAGLWPAALRERTLACFEWQHRIDEGFQTFAFWRPPSAAGLSGLDDVLAHTPLRTLALWSMGTGAGEQAVVARLASRDQRLEELLGPGALAARDHSRAAFDLARAPGDANVCRRTYALALAGRMEEARVLGDQIRARPDRPSDQAFWAWMDGRFAMRPRAR